jgi:hypothetical protein
MKPRTLVVARRVGAFVLMLSAVAAVMEAAAPREPVFVYDQGQPKATDAAVHVHEIPLPPNNGLVHIYASFHLGDSNPVPVKDGKPQTAQVINIGESEEGRFVPVLRLLVGTLFGFLGQQREAAGDSASPLAESVPSTGSPSHLVMERAVPAVAYPAAGTSMRPHSTRSAGSLERTALGVRSRTPRVRVAS